MVHVRFVPMVLFSTSTTAHTCTATLLFFTVTSTDRLLRTLVIVIVTSPSISRGGSSSACMPSSSSSVTDLVSTSMVFPSLPVLRLDGCSPIDGADLLSRAMVLVRIAGTRWAPACCGACPETRTRRPTLRGGQLSGGLFRLHLHASWLVACIPGP